MLQEKVNKKKLLITASTFPRYEGDTEPRFVLDIAKELNKYFDVTVLVPMAPGAKEHEHLEGVAVVRYHYFPIHKWEDLCYPGAIVPRIREKKIRVLLVPFLLVSLYLNLQRMKGQYDAVHVHWFIPQGIVQCFVKMPYLVTGHGADVTSLNQGMLKRLKQRVIRQAAAVTVVSEALKTNLEGHFKDNPLMQDMIAEKVQILPMGCNLSEFHPKYRKEEYWKQGKQKVLLFVGRLAEKKGVRFLIEAMQYIDARLVIVGTGPLEMELKRLSVEYGVQDKIVFEGAKNHEQLKVIYASADIFVMPSVTAKDGDTEGFGLVMLEAMASGLPVVAFKSGGIVNVIEHERNGLLAEAGDVQSLAECISRLMQQPELCDALKSRAYEDLQQYSYENIGKEYARIIEGMMGKQENED